MLFEYQILDVVGKNLSVEKPSEFGSKKRSYYYRFKCQLNLVVDLNILYVVVRGFLKYMVI